MSAQWAAADWGDEGTFVFPLADLRPHDIKSQSCWCRPIFVGLILVHNSADERELFERGERKPS